MNKQTDQNADSGQQRPVLTECSEELKSIFEDLQNAEDVYKQLVTAVDMCQGGSRLPEGIEITSTIKIGGVHVPISTQGDLSREQLANTLADAANQYAMKLLDLWDSAHQVTGRAVAHAKKTREQYDAQVSNTS